MSAALTRYLPREIPELRILGRAPAPTAPPNAPAPTATADACASQNATESTDASVSQDLSTPAAQTASPLQPFGAVRMEWLGSGFKLASDGAELWAEFTVVYEEYSPWIAVRVNGAFVQRICLPQGINRIPIYRNMDPQTVKTVEVFREIQPVELDPAMTLDLTAIETDGAFKPLPEPKCRIEIIGDSVSSGEGLVGALVEQDWNSMVQSVIGHYGLQVADALDADVRFFTMGGWGYYSDWKNDVRYSVRRQYTHLAATLYASLTDPETGEYRGGPGTPFWGGRGAEDVPGGTALMESRFATWDFANWQPDIIVVCLGPNDESGIRGETFTDPVTHAQYHNAPEKVTEGAVELFTLLREKNPKARILAAYGFLGHSLEAAIREAIRLCQNSGEMRLQYVSLPECGEDEWGSRHHPGPESHRKAAEAILKALQE